MTTLTTSAPVIRYGDTTDLGAVTALYARCSQTTLHRRFHAPLPRMPQRLVHETLVPKDGWSLVAELDGVVVGLASLGRLSTYDLELGLVVDDACRRRGIGTGLLRRAAHEAAVRGHRTLLCLAQCDNDPALRTLERSGLPTVSSAAGSLVRTVVPLSTAARPLPASA